MMEKSERQTVVASLYSGCDEPVDESDGREDNQSTDT